MDTKQETTKPKSNYRILTAQKTFLNAGTNIGSWLNLEQARKIVNYAAGEMIVEHDGMNVLWEAF